MPIFRKAARILSWRSKELPELSQINPVILFHRGFTQHLVTIDQEICPTIQPLPRVIIHVRGGLVQAVSSSEELDVQVYALDITSSATQIKIEQVQMIAAEFEQQCQGLQ